MNTVVVLISCVKTKRQVPCAAKDLYISDLFNEMRRFAERQGRTWGILSAKYGLLLPDQRVEPYELTLKKMAKPNRVEWSNKVFEKLETQLSPGSTIIFLAGKEYREYLAEKLLAAGHTVVVPMKGLSFGRQLQWLKNEGKSWTYN